jgi:site-specific DNA-methyltransferase (adenine-specific)
MPGYWPTRLRDGWEYCFHLAKSKRPYMNQDAVRKPIGEWVQTRLVRLGKNDVRRHNSVNRSGFGRDISYWREKDTVLPSNVISLPLVGRNKGHPAVFPLELPDFFIRLLSPAGGTVLDPFAGSGTTGVAAMRLARNCVLIDNDREYCRIAFHNLRQASRKTPCHVELVTPSGNIAGARVGRLPFTGVME